VPVYPSYSFFGFILLSLGMHKSRATKFCPVAPSVCGSPVWNLLRVTLLAQTVLRWLLHFWKISGLMANNCFDVIFISSLTFMHFDTVIGVICCELFLST
jgi:hypothetical protein